MDFPEPSPNIWLPRRNTATQTLSVVVVIITLFVVAIIIYLMYRRVYSKKCLSNAYCGGLTPTCNKTTGVCSECQSSADCQKGFICSTANTCV